MACNHGDEISNDGETPIRQNDLVSFTRELQKEGKTTIEREPKTKQNSAAH